MGLIYSTDYLIIRAYYLRTCGLPFTYHPEGAAEVSLSDISDMQEMNAAICEDSEMYETASLMDRRDGKYYTVAKLADGNCWMTENLRYGGVDTSGATITNDSNDTDLPEGTNFSLTESTPTGSAYNTDTSWKGTNTASEYHPDDSITGDQYWGYFYNWYAAVAGTVSGAVQQDASYSICPRGWTLPDNSTAIDSKSYSNLLWRAGIINDITDNDGSYAADGFAKLTSAPLSFLRAGWHAASGTSVNLRNVDGYYWSNSSSSATDAYDLLLSSYSDDEITPRANFVKVDGFSVRCVAR